jgi:hypothetical protein
VQIAWSWSIFFCRDRWYCFHRFLLKAGSNTLRLLGITIIISPHYH